ncbi:NBAS subunit of NRZ tethering complex [Rhinolophus ferrumequinum]|uniref:NBAS subunit of NRZ tethering complex n=1 Tax=Rhinolophus ferrumequinum TaxID=59479 RepID=A0A671EA10_RHIFE|nr:NBAS subunit of NRZ tethering complex [Rhinolophus ferrumequinum]KAF6321497.1 NBAS subunit of NRZ tethering complex [Rhinolophus ferrumequinum]
MAASESAPAVVPGTAEGEEETILYDLLVNTEWPPETEVQPRGNRKRGASFIITKAVTDRLLFLRQYIRYSPAPFLLPDGLVRLVNKQINWHMVLASNGKLLAAVQDQCVEIRSAKDDFTSIIGKCQVPKDPKPQWRRVAWSYDCTLLAYAESTGTVRVFDLMGSELFVIAPASSLAGDLSYAIAGLIFLEYKASAQWSAELLVVNYRGELRSYLVSVGTNQSYQESHCFSFSSYYPHGVNTAVYHPGHRLLLVGGCESAEVGISKASSCGLSAWRVLSGSPYYKQVTNGGDRVPAVPKTLGLLRMLSVKFYSRSGQEQDGIFKMSLSPDGTLLAAIHFSGKLSIWAIPSLKQQGEWNQNEQPGYDDINPDWRLSTEKRKKVRDKESFYPLIDVNWWADNAVTLARCSGALTVSSVKTLKNLLGKSCEWFEPSPQVTATHDGGFLSLECEIKLAPKRSRLEARGGEEDEGEEDSDSDQEMSAKVRYFGYVKQGLYLVTEMERFAPLRKRPRTITKHYRLVSLRSTTPEELYQRKIESEEYEEALSLAQTYGLDTDLVYQRQWRKSAVNIASIQNYLSKIKKRSWVLHECLERVPENVDAAKELLQYGLKGTDLEALLAIGKGADDGRFTLPGDTDIDGISYEELSLPDEEPAGKKKEKELKKRRKLLQLVNFSKLTLEQKELCRCRLKLLTYLDRLATYEEILGVSHASEQRYDAEFFKKFRNQNIVLSARNYARESNVQALQILFTYHGPDLLSHRLAILSNFPETTSPHEYSVLLPEACYNGDSLLIIPWHERKHRNKDWCEALECRMVVEPSLQDESEFLYTAQPELLRYKTAQLAVEKVIDWYQTRAEEIEHHARQVDCALSLIRLGMERNIPGLLVLCDNLVTLEALVYEAGCDLTLTLKELQQMKDIEKLRLLMNSCSEDNYVTSAYQWMVPFLHRCEKQSPGVANELLKEYLVTLAKGDLKLPLKIFQHSKPDLQQKIIPDQDQLMAVALECIYNCERNDQLSLCYDILECLPQRGYGQKTEVTTSLHDMVDQLEQILSVSELLEKHGLEKPISFVKNTQSSSEEARKLMVRLTRHTGRKQPPVSESHWRMLLQDMLTMQQNVYACLDSDACYQIFTESLLCSSRLENIHLAGQLMQCSACSVNPLGSAAPKGKPQYRVSYDKSIDLVLAASREYFNSSTSLTDSCMDLARCCLQLITDSPPAIQEELDLIHALVCLEEFGVKILPLQVRLCADRVSLIKECIYQSPTCYKQSTKLLGLAELLKVAGENPEERQGQVLILLVEQALRFHDYKAASVHCRELMATGYSKSWDVCSQLGQSEGFQDLATRQELMAFALTHCPPSSIELLLAASSSLQTEILYQRVNFQIHRERGESTNVSPLISKALPEEEGSVPGGSSADLLHWTTATTMKVLSNTTTTTKAVLQAVSDGQWWKKSLTYLRPLQGQEFGGAYQIGTIANEGLEKQGCHPFYESVISNPLVTESEVNYDTYQHVPAESFAEVLLRTGKLAETKTEGKELFPTTEVLLQLASDALPTDMTLALAYLLALPQVLDANKCFEKQPHSALCLQLAAYYYSLQIYARLAPCFRDRCHPLYRADPKELIRMVSRHVTRYGYEAWPEDVVSLTKQLQYYNERLLDFTQAQVLQGLGKGVHVQRFTADDQYKRETILGLAETLEENVYNIALSLAQRYGISRWEVFMTHLEFLFADSGLSTVEIENRAQALHLFETLKTDPEGFHKHMVKYIYPTIGGFDHERLLYYFTLLESSGCVALGKCAIKPETHIRLLKKFKVVASGLNYKKLTEENMNPLEALEPVLSSQNVLSISKLVPKIPAKGGRMLSPSSLYTVWLQKLFWTGDPHLMKQVPASASDWLHAYEVCTKYFDRLHPGDLITVLDAITFSPKAVTKLSVEARKEMTRKAIKTVRHFIEKPRKRSSEEDVQEASDSKVTYADTLSHLEKSLAHLETLNHSFIVSLKNSEQELLQKYSHLYDLSRSDRGRLQEQAVAMCLDGQPLRMIQQLMEVAVGPLDISPKDIVQSAIRKIVSALSGGSADLVGPGDPLQVLERVVAAIHASVDQGEALVSSEDLLAWLRPFCADDTRPVRPRIQVLQILGQSFHLSEEDSKLLVFFRTEAILKATWPQRQVDVSDIESEENRFSLFMELLESSHQEVEFQHLVLLLQAWPPMSHEYVTSTTNNPWVRLGTGMLSRCTAENKEGLGNEVLKMCRSLYNTKQMLPAACVKELCALLLNQSLLLPSLKLLLESQDATLHAVALEHVTAIAKVNDSNCDQELLSLLLDAKLSVKCISTPFYPRLIEHLLASPQQGRWDVEELARHLREAGHEAEAGSLLLTARGTHRALRTFSAALSAGQHWV